MVRDHGEYVIAPGGALVHCAPVAGQWPWRLVFAQVLPLVAAIQGLEPLHAGAIAINGEAWGIVGASGAGKTTLTVALVDQGAMLFADDVLAVERMPNGLVAHPGAGVVSMDDPRATQRITGARTVATTDKAHVQMPRAEGPLPLRRLYFLDRHDGDHLKVDRVWPPEPRLVLGSTFVCVVSGTARRVRQLDIHAAIAQQVTIFRLLPPRGWTPQRIADAVLRHDPGNGP